MAELRRCPIPTAAERRLAKTLLHSHGHSDPGVPLQWGHRTPKEWNREFDPVSSVEVEPPAILEPLPYQPFSHGIDYDSETARRYARVLRHLVNRPVLLTGGGGPGVYWGFLRSVSVVGRTNAKTAEAYANVQVCLCPFPSDPGAKPQGIRVSPYGRGNEPFCPWVGSWRVHALYGHGAEALR